MSTTNLSLAIGVLLSATQQAAKVSALIAVAHAEARDLSDAEVAGLQADDDAKRDLLLGAIESAKAG